MKMMSEDDQDLTTEPEQDDRGAQSELTPSQAWNLYVSHALSTWNARGYEFAAVRMDSFDLETKTDSIKTDNYE